LTTVYKPGWFDNPSGPGLSTAIRAFPSPCDPRVEDGPRDSLAPSEEDGPEREEDGPEREEDGPERVGDSLARSRSRCPAYATRARIVTP